MVASCAPPTGDLACNPGMCPDWELNQRPFGSQAWGPRGPSASSGPAQVLPEALAIFQPRNLVPKQRLWKRSAGLRPFPPFRSGSAGPTLPGEPFLATWPSGEKERPAARAAVLVLRKAHTGGNRPGADRTERALRCMTSPGEHKSWAAGFIYVKKSTDDAEFAMALFK